jgi:hypothetical protein
MIERSIYLVVVTGWAHVCKDFVVCCCVPADEELLGPRFGCEALVVELEFARIWDVLQEVPDVMSV